MRGKLWRRVPGGLAAAAAVADVAQGRSLGPDLAYLAELGAVTVTPGPDGGVWLTAAGLNFFEQVALGKTQLA